MAASAEAPITVGVAAVSAVQSSLLASAILALVASRHSTSTSTLRQHLCSLTHAAVGGPVDGERLSCALEELRSSFLIFEPQPGIFSAL